MLYSNHHVFGSIYIELQAKMREVCGLFHSSKHMTEVDVELCTLQQPFQSNRIAGAGIGTGTRAGPGTIVDTEIKSTFQV